MGAPQPREVGIAPTKRLRARACLVQESEKLSRVIAVLVVSCPCAFILATPTAMVAALSAAARLGILIKNVSDIELAARPPPPGAEEAG